jgi:hypothetical protein
MSQSDRTPSLKDGALYKAVNGVLVELILDEDDQALRKLRITPGVLRTVQDVQKRLRKALGGRKPDIGLVAEGMLVFAAQQPGVVDAVRDYAAQVYSTPQPQPEVSQG